LLYRKLHFLPYSPKILVPILLGGIVYITGYFMPALTNPYFDIVLKGGFVTVVFMSILYFLKISEDINTWINKVFRHC